MLHVEQMINSLGFPIACVVACGGYIFKMQEQNRKDTNAREERTFKQMDKLSETMMTISNTMIIISNSNELLNERIEKIEGHLSIERNIKNE